MEKSRQYAHFSVTLKLLFKPVILCIIFCLDTLLDVCMHTRLENGVLRNGQQPGSAGNSFFDYSKFEAMKSLSGWDAARCGKHQFRAKIKVSTRAIFELSLFDK